MPASYPDPMAMLESARAGLIADDPELARSRDALPLDWWDRSGWRHRTFESDQVAAALGIATESLRVTIHRAKDHFPPARRTQSGNRWNQASVYAYIVNHRAERIPFLPRMFPRTATPSSAAFAGAEVIAIGERDYGVHHWIPRDDGSGMVSIAYPIGSQPVDNRAARIVLERLRAAGVDAVFVVGDFVAHQSLLLRHQQVEQPEMLYSDTTGFNDVVVWGDAANLLRCELPYFAPALRHRSIITGWTSGAGPRLVDPLDANYGRGNPLAALAAHLPYAGRELLSDVHRHLSAEIARDGGEQRFATTADEADPHGAEKRCAGQVGQSLTGLGWTVAAVPLSYSRAEDSSPDPVLDAGALRQLLDVVPVGTPASVTAAVAEAAGKFSAYSIFAPYLGSGMQPMPLIARSQNGLFRCWVDRLVEHPASEATTLGWLLAEQLTRWARSRFDDQQGAPWRHLVDPLNPDQWIIDTGDTLYVSGSQAIPGVGHLDSVEVVTAGGHPVGVWTDETATAWPLPVNPHTDYNIGYWGGGPVTLAELITALSIDATQPFPTRLPTIPRSIRVAITEATERLVLGRVDPAQP